jgi:HK97 family phage prohead protease
VNETIRRLFGLSSVKAAVGGGTRSFDVIASTDDVDLEGEVLVQDWDLRRFTKNPVVLYFHNIVGMFGGEPEDTLPVGFATNVAIEEGKLVATINFVDEKANPMAEMCFQGFSQGSLRAVSVGFRPKQGSVETRNGQDVYVLRGNELLEISVCPVPCNPNAVTVEDRAKALDALKAFVKSPLSTTAADLENVMKALALLLGLKADASEADILAAITAIQSGSKALELRVLEATGAKSADEAFGLIKSGVEALKQLGIAQKSLAAVKIEGEKRDRDALIAKGYKLNKMTPALEAWARATTKSADGTETFKESLDTLASWIESAPTVSAFEAGPNKPLEQRPEGTKAWEEMEPAEKHNLNVENPAMYATLKADWEKRGKPAMKYAQPKR